MTHQANMEILPTNLKKPERSFYLSWIVLTAISVPIAFFFSLVTLKIITNIVGDYVVVNGVRHITEDYLAMYALVPSISILTGVLQYALLRRYLPRMGWWVLVTVAGWFLGVLLIALPSWIGWADAPINNLDLIFLIMGLAIGVSQWLFLRHRLVRAAWWIAANLVGWGLLGLITPNNSVDQFGLFTLGFVPACATAAMLAMLMHQVSPADPQM